jgi:FlaA1/EpsC-like NDP-sugar epimerase
MNRPFTNRRILLTGAGGSIGSALARALIHQQAALLILLDHSEGNLHQLNFELGASSDRGAVSSILGDVCDAALLSEIFEERKPDIIIHAAAYKHVPLMEHNPLAAIRNNAIGTYRLAQLARQYNVETLLMVSTDKAVNPHSVMGASKRLAELALLRWNTPPSGMRAIRMGNVLGSQGSVVPLFQQQIAAGGPVTVTHQEVARYFTTMDEAIELVLLAANLPEGGGIFTPYPSAPVRIQDLAERMIRKSGIACEREIHIILTGLRPGEKMSEEFVSEFEQVEASSSPKLRKIKTPQIPSEDFDSLFSGLQKNVASRDLAAALEVLRQIVPEYCPSEVVLAAAKQEQSSPL